MAELTPPPSQNNTPLRPSDNAEPSSPTPQSTPANLQTFISQERVDNLDGRGPSGHVGMDVDEQPGSFGALEGGDIEEDDEDIEELASVESEGEDGMRDSDDGKMEDRSEDGDSEDGMEATYGEDEEAMEAAGLKGKGKSKIQEVDSDAASEGWRAQRGGHRSAAEKRTTRKRGSRGESKAGEKLSEARGKKDELPEQDIVIKWNQEIGDVCYSQELEDRVKEQIAHYN